MPASNDSQPADRGEGLASRYEALARIADLIRVLRKNHVRLEKTGFSVRTA